MRLPDFLQLSILNCSLLVVTSSCIEEYNELPEQLTDPMVVITGEIVSGEDCTFYVTGTSDMQDRPFYVPGSKVSVRGTDGTIFPGSQLNNETYMVPVGELKPDVEYYVMVENNYGHYRSEPMRPLDAPAITELVFDQPRLDKVIDFILSTEDTGGPMCFQWDYEECWEVYTPFTELYACLLDRHDGPDDTFYYSYHFERVPNDELTNHGWVEHQGTKHFGSNDDYANGAIRRMCLYQGSRTDHRFQTRYRTLVRQKAITREEYEYQQLLRQQSTGMGGLFTPMPTELPTNISYSGEVRGMGYVGVRGKVSSRELYVRSRDVHYQSLDEPYTVPDTLVESPIKMVQKGYHVKLYNPYSGELAWTKKWCVDCRDYYWDYASLERPRYWIDDPN